MYAIIPEGWLTGERRRYVYVCIYIEPEKGREIERERDIDCERPGTVYRDGNDNGPNLTHSSTPRPRLPF
jgi:hypothetical protein